MASPLIRAIPVCALQMAIALALLTAPAFADEPFLDDPVCQPPISTCHFAPGIEDLAPGIEADGASLAVSPIDRQDSCIAGYRCVCVPSCPECDDCAAQVCIDDPVNECKTACDCEPGLGCFDGQCIAGIAPVYCCESDVCPANEQCQHRSGRRDQCADPMCMERVRKVTHQIGQLVKRAGYCRIDNDCARIHTTTECIGTCGAFINRRHVEVVGKLIDRLDNAICDGFQEDGCAFATPSCQLSRGKCIENRCEAVPILPPVPGPRITPKQLPSTGTLLELERQ